MDDKLAIFLSHSHKDIEKIRKIRNLLETLGCEPLMFHLKCLDDNNTQLEEFIMREISARNIFLYCKSQNSERSIWVKRELAYIRQLDTRRLYTLDIDNDFEIGLISVLNSIVNLLRRNRIYFYCAPSQMPIASKLGTLLAGKGYYIKYFHPDSRIYSTPSMKNLPVHEFLKFKNQIEIHLEREIIPLINEGIFIPILSSSLFD